MYIKIGKHVFERKAIRSYIESQMEEKGYAACPQPGCHGMLKLEHIQKCRLTLRRIARRKKEKLRKKRKGEESEEDEDCMDLTVDQDM